MDQYILIIQQCLDQATKSGVIGNLQTAAALAEAWEKVKTAALNGSANGNNGN